jgi:hypothetical protein
MALRAILTPEDMMKGEAIPPGWYPAEVSKYEEAAVKGSAEKPSDGSVNAIFYFKLLDGPGKGKEIKRFFNEKSLGFGKNLWAVLFSSFDKKKGGELNSEMFTSAVGKKLKVYVKRDDNGKWDTIEDYQPLM